MTFKRGRQFNKIRQIRIRSTPIFHMNWINTKCSIFFQNWAETVPCCEVSDCPQMSKTIIAVRHFGLGGRESLETAVSISRQIKSFCNGLCHSIFVQPAPNYSRGSKVIEVHVDCCGSLIVLFICSVIQWQITGYILAQASMHCCTACNKKYFNLYSFTVSDQTIQA